MRTLIIAAAIALLMTPIAHAAGPYSSFYILPTAGHTPGAFGTIWATDVAVFNPQSESLDVSFVFIQSGEGNADNAGPINIHVAGSSQPIGSKVTVPAGGSVMLRDIVSDYRGMTSVTGALMVGAARPFAIASRTYNTTNNVGEAVEPFRDFLDNSLGVSDNSAIAYVPALVANASSRSNLGFVAATANGSAPMIVMVTLTGGDGKVLGSRSFVVPAGGALEHVQVPSTAMFNGSFDLAAAQFQIVSGNGAVVPYASIVDNTSADGIFVGGQFPANSGVAAKTFASAFAAAFARLQQ